jgi:hypothetical protein
MKTKIFYGNQYIGSTTIDGRKYSKWQIFKSKATRYTKRVILVSFIASVGGWIAGGAISYVYHMRPVTVYAEKTVEVADSTIPPVLLRIMKCESDNHQYGKTGQVLMKANTNGSVDVGVMQINVSIWGSKAKELGYDLTKESDNIAMGEWIYGNYGTEPWYLSAKCWSK